MTETQPLDLSGIDAPAELETASRTVTWVRPGQIDPAQLALLDGVGQLEAMRELGIRPPISDTVDMEDLEVEKRRVVVRLRPQEFHYNPLGGMHGGIYATLLDTACGCAVHSTLNPGEGYTSLDLTTKFLRGVTVDSGRLTCEGTVLQRGRRTALAQASIVDESGRLVAHATSSCMIFS